MIQVTTGPVNKGDSEHNQYRTAHLDLSLDCNDIIIASFNPFFRVQDQVNHFIGNTVLSAVELKFTHESQVATKCAIVDGLRPDSVSSINQFVVDGN